MFGALQRMPPGSGAPPLAMLSLPGFAQTDAARQVAFGVGHRAVRLRRGFVAHVCIGVLHSLAPVLLSGPSEPFCGEQS